MARPADLARPGGDNVLRILQVVDSLATGGAERVVITLSQGFVDAGCRVDVVTIDDVQEFALPPQVGYNTLAFRKALAAYPRYRARLHRLIRSLEQEGGKFDLILVHLQKATRLMGHFRHPAVFHCLHSTLSRASLEGRGGLRRWLKRRRLRHIYDGLDLVAVSEGIADDVANVIGVRPRTVRTIYNPVDVARVRSAAHAPEPVPDEPYIVHVGRLAEVKRHDRLLRAYQESNVEAKLLLVGEGPMRAAIERQIDTLDLKERVILCGHRSNPYPLVNRARLLLLTSDYEGLPTVLIEALALGTPVVSVDCPSGPREILRGSLAEGLVPMDDEPALAAAIARFATKEKEIALDPDVLRPFELFSAVNSYLSLCEGRQ